MARGNGILVGQKPVGGMGRGLKLASFVLAVLIALGGVATVVYAAGVLVESKADRKELKAVEDRVDGIHTDVQVIKTEQRMLIRAIRPDLPVGKE
jgi:hypothetical protein